MVICKSCQGMDIVKVFRVSSRWGFRIPLYYSCTYELKSGDRGVLYLTQEQWDALRKELLEGNVEGIRESLLIFHNWQDKEKKLFDGLHIEKLIALECVKESDRTLSRFCIFQRDDDTTFPAAFSEEEWDCVVVKTLIEMGVI